MREELESLTREVKEEKSQQEQNIHRLWAKPLGERIDSCRALGNLTIAEIDSKNQQIHFHPPAEDFALFREQEPLRLSRNDPAGNYFQVIFLGLTNNGLSVQCRQLEDFAFNEKSGWSLDEDFFDLSPFYLRAIESLAEDAHGRDHVFPVLFEDQTNEECSDTYSDVAESLDNDENELNDSQVDAVATALASSPFHLIQGPPGTGKTHTLAQLVDQLVIHGHRILVTGFTHRSIHNALIKIQQLVDSSCPVVKISPPVVSERLPFPVYDDFSASGLDLEDGPYIIGATPFALASRRLSSASFDSAVIDETSQLTIPAAIMVMMKSDRWFFFGDQCQLPPVSHIHRDSPRDASIFGRLVKQSKPTKLDTTYRMNDELTEWPSETFYQGELESANPNHRLPLKQTPRNYRELIQTEYSLVNVSSAFDDSRSRNDDEADLAADITLNLLESGIPAKEIGIITPFRAQASRIRQLLRHSDRFQVKFPNAYHEIGVDTVDRFQGQEREVIIYSFTASDSEFIRKLDNFIFQSERLNVAVTRARSLVILLHSANLRRHAETIADYHEPAAVFLSLLAASREISLHPTHEHSK